MNERQGRVHLEVERKPGWALNLALCGWADVQATSDIGLVTCRSCRRLLRPKRAKKETDTPLAVAIAPFLAPVAGPPPRLSHDTWRDSCKGAEHRRCGQCELCAWEREADRWAFASPWTKQHVIARAVGAPTWSSLSAALIALADWERHDRVGPSAMGFQLDRMRAGQEGDGGRSRPEDPLLRRAGELVAVRQALEHAYPEGAHWLPMPVRMRLLLERTPGVLDMLPTFEELALREGAAVGDVRALVRAGRDHVAMELVERGLIPTRELARRVRQVTAATAGWR